MKRRSVYLVTAFLILLAAPIIYSVRCGKRSEYIRTTGIVEGREVNISSKVSGKILEICCKEGDAVTDGSIAIKLEAADLRASVKQALAGVEKAKAEMCVSEASIESARATIANSRAEIKSAAADAEKYRVLMEDAKRQMNREKELDEQRATSKESYDTAVANYDAAVAGYEASLAKLAAAYSKNDVAVAQLNAAESQMEFARAGVKEAKANVLYYRARYADTFIRSPLSGIVVFKASEKGEMVTPGMTILTVVDLNDLSVRVDIEETLVGNIGLRSGVDIRPAGQPDRIFKGHVSEIGRYAEFATQRDVLRGRQDIKTFRIKIRVDDPTGYLKPGMTVDVVILKRKENGTTK